MSKVVKDLIVQAIVHATVEAIDELHQRYGVPITFDVADAILATCIDVAEGNEEQSLHAFNTFSPIVREALAKREEMPLRFNPDGSVAMCPCGSGQPVGSCEA